MIYKRAEWPQIQFISDRHQQPWMLYDVVKLRKSQVKQVVRQLRKYLSGEVRVDRRRLS